MVQQSFQILSENIGHIYRERDMYIYICIHIHVYMYANIHRSGLKMMVSVSLCDSSVVLHPLDLIIYCDKVTEYVSFCDVMGDGSYIYAFLVTCVISVFT